MGGIEEHMNDLISVIVPIYKTELYLRKCVDSLINQTYTNLEIILVDDGSPDGCPQICDEYAAKDSRIKVIHKENGGVSAARNFGLDHASGAFIAYIDSDDYVSENYIEYLVELAERYDADIACCGYIIVSSHTEAVTDNRLDSGFLCSGNEACRIMLTERYNQLVVAWGKIFKAELARRFKFPKGKIYEDALTTYKYYYYCDRVAIGDAKLYAYYSNDGGITASNDYSGVFKRAAAHRERAEFFEGKKERTLARLAWEGTLTVYYIHSVLYNGMCNAEIKAIIKSRWYKGYIGIFTLAKCCALLWFPKLYKKVRALLGK